MSLEHNSNKRQMVLRCIYYAIAGIDYPHSDINKNDYCFEMPTNFSTYADIQYFLKSKSLYFVDSENYDNEILPDIKSLGDNMVGFLSQIGWTENDSSLPDKKSIWKKYF